MLGSSVKRRWRGPLPAAEPGRRNQVGQRPGRCRGGPCGPRRRARRASGARLRRAARTCRGRARRPSWATIRLGFDRKAQPLRDVLADPVAALAARPRRVVVGTEAQTASSAGISPRRRKNASVASLGRDARLAAGAWWRRARGRAPRSGVAQRDLLGDHPAERDAVDVRGLRRRRRRGPRRRRPPSAPSSRARAGGRCALRRGCRTTSTRNARASTGIVRHQPVAVHPEAHDQQYRRPAPARS